MSWPEEITSIRFQQGRKSPSLIQALLENVKTTEFTIFQNFDLIHRQVRFRNVDYNKRRKKEDNAFEM